MSRLVSTGRLSITSKLIKVRQEFFRRLARLWKRFWIPDPTKQRLSLALEALEIRQVPASATTLTFAIDPGTTAVINETVAINTTLTVTGSWLGTPTGTITLVATETGQSF